MPATILYNYETHILFFKRVVELVPKRAVSTNSRNKICLKNNCLR